MFVGWTACGDRRSTKSAFLNAREQDPETFALLLVDAQATVAGLSKAHIESGENGPKSSAARAFRGET